jgi:hypothetical protein
VLNEYERAARCEKLSADRQREYRSCQPAASEGRAPVTSQNATSKDDSMSAEGGLCFRLHRLRIDIRLDRAQPSN